MTKSSRVPVIGILLIGVICPSARVSAEQRPAIAEQIAKTYGLDSWDQVEAIRYTFNVDWPALRLKTSRSLGLGAEDGPGLFTNVVVKLAGSNTWLDAQ